MFKLACMTATFVPSCDETVDPTETCDDAVFDECSPVAIKYPSVYETECGRKVLGAKCTCTYDTCYSYASSSTETGPLVSVTVECTGYEVADTIHCHVYSPFMK